MEADRCEVLVVGAGITGLTIARELLARGVRDVMLLEKEPALGAHASGRNSGVLHAGVYYAADTLKARFCLEGNRRMKEFCRSKGLTLRETGKVIVTRGPSELAGLYELKRRAEAAGARVRVIGADELAEIEPSARTAGRALFTPETAVIRPKEILEALAAELVESGAARISYGTSFEGIESVGTARTSRGRVRYSRLVNAAGAHADAVAHMFGVGSQYRLVPFIGTYKRLSSDAPAIRGNIYPVPDFRTPFLGVHLTRGADDVVTVGPTAIPAFGRDAYRFRDFGEETPEIVWRDIVLAFTNPSFRRAAVTEPRKYLRRFLFHEARALVPSLRLRHIESSGKVGIRPQLVHLPTRRLVMDFVVIKDAGAVHVLNAISPAFTSSMAFARHCVDALLA